MRDLLLWRELLADAIDAERVVPLLEELADAPIRARIAFFGALDRALEHDDVRVRRAAVSTLAGADGPLAWHALVRALDDRSIAVRTAAVAALRVSSETQPSRWAHALFHRDPDVRRAALEGPAPQGARAWSFYLLADTACAELVRRDVEVPSGALPAVIDFARRGIVEDDEARAWIAGMPWQETASWLENAHRRSPEQVQAIVASQGVTAAGDDALDDLFALVWRASDLAVRRRIFEKIGDALKTNWSLRQRVVAALLVAGRARGFIPEAAEIAAAYHPWFLGFDWVPRETRYAALAGVYRIDAYVQRAPDPNAKPLFELDLVRRPHGGLDLWAIGALLRFLQKEPYQTLLGWISEKEIVDAFVRDMEHSAPFLSLQDTSKKGRAHVIDAISRGAPGRRAEVLAYLAHVVSANELGFMDSLGHDEARALASTLLTLSARPGIAFSANKVERIANALGPAIASTSPEAFLRDWLGHKSPESLPIGLALLGVVARTVPLERFVATCASLDTFLLKRLVEAIPFAPRVTYGTEVALAHALLDHVSPAIHAWARERVPEPGSAAPPPVRRSGVTRVSPALEAAIASADEGELPDVIAPCLAGATIGLTTALRKRGTPRHPVLAVCVALLGSHDDPVEVAIELERFGARDRSFAEGLDEAATRTWHGSADLALLGNAVLHRFERHAFALVEEMLKRRGGIPGQLAGALMLRSAFLCEEIWRGVARVFGMWRWRDRERLDEVATEALVELLVSHLDTSVGEAAARALVTIFEARVAPELLGAQRARVTALLPECTDATRRELEPFVDSRGLPSRTAPARARAGLDEALLAEIRRSEDLDALAALCRGTDERLVHEAALRLIVVGDEGTLRIARLLGERPLPSCHRPLCDSIALWSSGPALDALRSMIAAGIEVPELAHRVAVALVEKGEPHWLGRAYDALRADTEGPSWFRARDWERLDGLATDRLAMYRALTISPHPHAYRPAVDGLLSAAESERQAGIDPDDATLQAIRDFLDAGTERVGELRRRAAWWLHEQGDMRAFPIVVADTFTDEGTGKSRAHALFGRASAREVTAAVDGALVAGHAAASEQVLVEALLAPATGRMARETGLERVLTDCDHTSTRQRVVQAMPYTFRRARKLRAIADTFAWGMRVGRELSGRLFRFHMIGGKGLGYTRLNTNHVFVSPLPLLRGDRHGREIVEALVLHEIGHHLYHRGDEEAKVWARAQSEGIGGLLNLVADEHLERNVRAIDASFGDRLKRLAAYAFQHADKEIKVPVLFDMMHGRTFEVLSQTPLGVARVHGCVRVDNGALLSEMEKAGLRFARFVRALRMGLGDRHDDPLIAQGLELFNKGFKKGDMQSLLDVSHRLQELFGWEVSICETFGGHETAIGDGPEGTIHGEGIDDDAVQREVERVLDPRKATSQSGAIGRGGKLFVNVNPDEQFDTIDHVEKIPPDPATHRPIAAQVARHAKQMRRYLERLGLGMVPQRMRLSGRRFDPSRATAVVTRGDPRMLIAREVRVTTDLFIGVMVDCSGSMYGQNMEKARAFGVLLAEAARGLPGVDLRLFGFTDRVIYDAGDARSPAVASLEANGGNNDAAALAHVAGIAKRSRRRAKLLVMISDGLPTECSVAALRGLVRTLTRREKMCCAQVAVRPISEVCFPHYVELNEEELDPAVRRFGTIVAGLVRKAMGT